MQRHILIKVWIVCALGLFIDGFDLYITSVAEPFFKQSLHLTPIWLGVSQAAAPIGAAIGAVLVGRIADHLGRKSMLVANFVLFVLATLCSALSWDVYSLCFFRFWVGFGVGADYPICAAYLAEMAPDSSRGKLMASAMFINCLASPIGVAIAYGIVLVYPHLSSWRLMFAFGAVPAVIALVMRSRLPESLVWRIQQRLDSKAKQSSIHRGYQELFTKPYFKMTLALCLCWFLMDISYYGIGLFTPDILSALHLSTGGNFITATKTIVESTIFVNLFVALGAFISIFLIDKMSRTLLQKIGFFGAFIGLFILAISGFVNSTFTIPIIFSCFMIYNIFVNLGPGITTYLLPSELYPTSIRATGHGVASGTAKFGAFIGAIFLPEVQKISGVYNTVLILSLTLLLGLALTFLLKQDDHPVQFSRDETTTYEQGLEDLAQDPLLTEVD